MNKRFMLNLATFMSLSWPLHIINFGLLIINIILPLFGQSGSVKLQCSLLFRTIQICFHVSRYYQFTTKQKESR